MKNNILIIVAHADDEVLGCGGTIAKHKRASDHVDLIILTNSAASQEGKSIENRLRELELSCKILKIDTFKMLNFEDNQLDKYPLLEIIKETQKILGKTTYNLVYTHSINDLNIDHRITNQVTLTLFRPLPNTKTPNILTFDIPSSVEYQSPNQLKIEKNYYSLLSKEDLDLKLKALEAYKSESNDFPHPRSSEYLEIQAKHEGSRCGNELAESFYIERMISTNKND
ncbi:PIG-L deacetylase family protein [Halobacteriovorax sp.]|uniref:PIG-L deacetylase family protein n=1 Tax=Halobacteriovorax sp. TaxID=2020862 RepID=UPI003AF2D41E